MKKFQSITIPTAVASVKFLARNSGVIGITRLEDRKKLSNGGSTKCKIGNRTATPARFTAKNIPNWCANGLERDSGYVQNRFHMKLLIMAHIKEIVPANISCMFKKCERKFAIPKSINAPMVPTTINLRNRVRSIELLKTTVIQFPIFVWNKG